MSIPNSVPEGEVTGTLATIYQEGNDDIGYVMSHTKGHGDEPRGRSRAGGAFSTAASEMTDADSQHRHDAGFTDTEIVNITLAAAACNYYSRAIQALAVDADVPAGISPELAKALVGGLD